MNRKLAVGAVLLAGAVAAAAIAGELASSGHAPVRFEASTPAPARSSAARLVTGEGRGRRRVSLWLARNANGDLCVGWQLGGGRPRAFRCQRRGLERPVLWIQAAGGLRTRSDWGGAVGLVAPGVTRVVLNDARVSLRPVGGTGGWRSFAHDGAPGSLEAYAGNRRLLEDDGLWVNPEGLGCACSRRGDRWWGTFAYVPEQQHGADARAATLALATPGVARILSAHGPAWIDQSVTWGRCAGGTIGVDLPIMFWRPATFHATLPFEQPEPSGTHVSYVTGVHRVLAVRSPGLDAWVDTHAWRVVGVETNLYAGLEIPLGTTRSPRPGGGYDDPSACPAGGD